MSFLILDLLIGVLVVILRVEEDYTVLSSYEKSDTSSTQYLGFQEKRMNKYQCRRRLLYGWKWTDALELYL